MASGQGLYSPGAALQTPYQAPSPQKVSHSYHLPAPSLSTSTHHPGELATLTIPSTVPTQRNQPLLNQGLGRSADLGHTASLELQLGAA